MKAIMALLSAVLALAGCDHVALGRLEPGRSTVEDVRRELGEPSFTWQEGDGGQTLEYAGVPDISKNQMIAIDRNGVLLEVRQVVTDENFRRVDRGMNKDQVRRLLGKPYSVEYFVRKQQEVWDWKAQVTSGGEQDWRFNVHFGADGAVEEVSLLRSR